MLRKLLRFDQSFPELLPDAVIGIDEVGRGCLAGPVVAAAVCLPPIEPGSKLSIKLKTLNDSKKLTAAMRESLTPIIQEIAVFAIAEASVEEINELNILHAGLLAMKRARAALKAVPRAVVLVDGNHSIPGIKDPQIPVVQGDGKSAAIAAASVIAKVYRDALMLRLHDSFKQYCFDRNKGYGTKDHWNALREHGPTQFHRKAFIRYPGLAPVADTTIENLDAAPPDATEEVITAAYKIPVAAQP